MRMNLAVITSVPFLLMTSCTGTPWLRREGADTATTGRSETSGNQPGRIEAAARPQVELQNVRFDGQALHGRLLVTSVEGSLVLDKRLIESVVLTTESVTECETGRKLSFMEMDVLAPLPRDEDLLVLKPGYWYGKEVRLPLFTQGLNGPADIVCIEAELTFHPREGGTASLRVRGVAAPFPTSDAGTEAPPVLNLDAGASGP